jgi:hypothetical protein
MAEQEDIKKTFVFADEQLVPEVTNYIRFRVVTEDGERASHWSKVYAIPYPLTVES